MTARRAGLFPGGDRRFAGPTVGDERALPVRVLDGQRHDGHADLLRERIDGARGL